MAEQNRSAPTLEDVAARVGMSVATVGRALGGYGKVAPATKKRVLEAARELNYHANAVARGMKERRTQTIGLIVGNIRNPFFSTIVRAVEDTVSSHGYLVIVCNTDESEQKEFEHARSLFERRVDGLIVSPTSFEDEAVGDATKAYYGTHIPTVFVDRNMDDVSVPSFYSDNAEGSYVATKHLLSLGHRRIGVVVGKRSLTTMTDRVRGYERALAESGVPVDEGLIVDSAHHADVGVEGGYAATRALFAETSDPTAILVMNNLLVVGALRAIRELDLDVPVDVSIIAWDDFELARYLTPPLTVVDQAVYSMGAMAAERLMKAVLGEVTLGRLDVLLKPTLIVRESTAQPAHLVTAGRSETDRRETRVEGKDV